MSDWHQLQLQGVVEMRRAMLEQARQIIPEDAARNAWDGEIKRLNSRYAEAVAALVEQLKRRV